MRARPLHTYFPGAVIGKVWSDPTRNLSSKVTVVSVSGGERDVMVPAHLSATPSSPVAMAVSERDEGRKREVAKGNF